MNKNLLRLALQLLIVFSGAFLAASIEQPFLIPIAKAAGSFGDLIGLAAGLSLFMSLFLSRKGLISSTTFRAVYMIGCLGFAILASEKIFVLTLENAFLLDLGFSIYMDTRRS